MRFCSAKTNSCPCEKHGAELHWSDEVKKNFEENSSVIKEAVKSAVSEEDRLHNVMCLVWTSWMRKMLMRPRTKEWWKR